MTKGKEELINTIKVAIFEAFDAAEPKIEAMCKKNIQLHLQGHELECPGRTSKLKSIINWSALSGIIGLIIEKVVHYSNK